MSAVNHPKHYNVTVPGIECIDVIKWFDLCLGNAMKYIWRAGHKGDMIEDLEKAIWYLDCKINMLKREQLMNTDDDMAETGEEDILKK